MKQNQNLFLSLQGKEDKMTRWKYTILVLDNMIDQIRSNNGQFKFSSTEKDSEINFVSIAEKLPKLLVENPDDPTKKTKISI